MRNKPINRKELAYKLKSYVSMRFDNDDRLFSPKNVVEYVLDYLDERGFLVFKASGKSASGWTNPKYEKAKIKMYLRTLKKRKCNCGEKFYPSDPRQVRCVLCQNSEHRYKKYAKSRSKKVHSTNN